MNNKKKNPLFIKLLSVILSFVMLYAAAISTYAETTTKRDFEQEISNLEAQIDANNSKKSDSQKTRAELQEEINTMQQQLDVYTEKINALNSQIAEKDKQIETFEADIAALDVEINTTNTQIDTLNVKINETYDVLKERLKASYMAGKTSTLDILMGAKDFESFLTRMKLLSIIAKKDDELVSGLQNSIKELDDLKVSLDSKKAEQEDKKRIIENEKTEIVNSRNEVQKTYNTLNSKQTAIEKKVQSVNSIMQNIDQSSAEYRAEIAAIEKARDEYDKKFSGGSSGDGTLSGGGSSDIGNYPVSSMGMICPLQYSDVYVSSPFGKRSSGMHRGIDLCTRGTGSTYGKEIRAAASGTVVSAEYHYSWGNNVYIDHGNGVKTRYAHCSSMVVKSGQYVQQGQVIAYVGSTGQSSGPHLHFEVWINGDRVNPAPYFNLP